MDYSKLIIDVVSDTPPADSTQTNSLLRRLCKKSFEIETSITSALSKTSFKNVNSTQLSGKGNCKVTKEFLDDSIFSIHKIIDAVDPIINTEPPILHTSSGGLMSDTSHFDKYLTGQSEKFDVMVKNLV